MLSIALSRTLVAYRLGRRADVDRFAWRMFFSIVAREVVLRIEMGAANDAVVLMRMFHFESPGCRLKAARRVPSRRQESVRQTSSVHGFIVRRTMSQSPTRNANVNAR